VLTHRFKPEAFVRLNEIMSILMIDVVPVTPAQAQIGFDAYRRFGRGGQSGAKLNIGDCFAYALAIDTGQPLLFKGDDFIHTDVKRAV
jgi:ribonuclease VapC